MALVSIGQDRSLSVPPGKVIKTGYVHVFNVKLACRDRMTPGDLAHAYQKRLQLGDHQSWPCPNGYWEDDRFIIVDGRHEWVSAVMIGQDYIFVAWLEDQP